MNTPTTHEKAPRTPAGHVKVVNIDLALPRRPIRAGTGYHLARSALKGARLRLASSGLAPLALDRSATSMVASPYPLSGVEDQASTPPGTKPRFSWAAGGTALPGGGADLVDSGSLGSGRVKARAATGVAGLALTRERTGDTRLAPTIARPGRARAILPAQHFPGALKRGVTP